MRKKLLLLFCLIAGYNLTNTASAQVIFSVDAPSVVAGSYNFEYVDNTWGVDMMTHPLVTDTLMVVSDGTAGDSLGCNAITNNINGKIAVIYRGSCEFGTKSLNAQNAGAVAVIIVNNVAGAAVGMLPGSNGANVTIPVINISKDDGATLRSYIDAGSVIATIGNKTGVFPADLVIFKQDVVRADNYAMPKALADNNLEINTGSWVHNYGSTTLNNIQLKATVTKSGVNFFHDSATVASLNPMDSVFIDLATFSLASYDTGFYHLDYKATSDVAESYPSDNEYNTTFYINNNYMISKSVIDQATRTPVASNYYGYTAATAPEGTKLCITINEPNIEDLKATGIAFALQTSTGKTMTNGAGVYVDVELNSYTTDADTINSYNPEALVTYDFTSDLQKTFITVPFPAPITLIAGTKYLACVITYEDSLYIGCAADIDYTATVNANMEYNSALMRNNVDQSFIMGGFGFDATPAIILKTTPSAVGITEKNNSLVGAAFPNPASDFISIPLNGKSGKLNVMIYDVTGKLVKSETSSMNGNLLKVNTESINNGSYMFKITFEDMSVTSFPVVITK